MGSTVSRQTGKNLTVNRQKKADFTRKSVNRQDNNSLLAVKRFQGLSNLSYLGLLALTESF